MSELTNIGLSAIAKGHERTMSALFNLTIRPPKKIEVKYEEGYGLEELIVVKRDGVTKIEWIPF